MTEPTSECKFDFPCPHCDKTTPVVMTVSGGIPKAAVTTIVHSQDCDFSVGIDRGAEGGDFTAFAIGANGGAFPVGRLPAGVEIDAGGAWIDKIEPTPSAEVAQLVRHTMGEGRFTMVDPAENFRSVQASVGTTEAAKRECPTCGTPAFSHPDRIRGEDALPIPRDALIRGATMICNMMPDRGMEVAELVAEAVFREMLDPKPGKLTVGHIDFLARYARAYATTPAAYRSIVEQVAAMDGRSVSGLELTMVVAQAKQALNITEKSA